FKDVDINNDSVLDEVSLKGKGDTYKLEKAYIEIRDGNNKENVLAVFESDKEQTNINDFYDINGDGVLDIIIDCHRGDSLGGFISIYKYDNGDFKKVDIKEPTITLNFEKALLTIKEESSKTIIKKEPSSEALKAMNLKENSVINMKLNEENDYFEILTSAMNFQDSNGDGKKELVKSYIVKDKKNNGTILEFDAIYNYNNGFEVQGILDKGSFNKEFEKYQ
ncbi:MAG: hypothetical protein ACRDD2_00480, partial [Sarcina sp.]